MSRAVTHIWADPEKIKPANPVKPLSTNEKKPEPLKIPATEPEIKGIDLTQSRNKCLDYKDLKFENGTVKFNIRLWDKNSVLKLHPIICEKEDARQFARKILHITSKFSEIYKIIDEE